MENVIYIAAPRDWFDYLAILAPLALSAIAVIIAVSTARKQNKIALFDKRFLALEYLSKVLSFSDTINQEDLKEESLGCVPELKIWTVIQIRDKCLTEHISFIPYPMGETIEMTPEAIRRDVDIMRNQVLDDAYNLSRACPLFPEPIRSELEALRDTYLEYMIALLSMYRDGVVDQEQSAHLKLMFMSQCVKFKGDSKLMKAITRLIKL